MCPTASSGSQAWHVEHITARLELSCYVLHNVSRPFQSFYIHKFCNADYAVEINKVHRHFCYSNIIVKLPACTFKGFLEFRTSPLLHLELKFLLVLTKINCTNFILQMHRPTSTQRMHILYVTAHWQSQLPANNTQDTVYINRLLYLEFLRIVCKYTKLTWNYVYIMLLSIV